MAIGVGRAKRTQFNWVITGVAAAVNVGLNLVLIPPYGIMGAAVATVVAYVVMFLGMTWYAQRVFPTPYQWRRVFTAVAAAVGLLLVGKALGGLTAAIVLSLAYPFALRSSASCFRTSGLGCEQPCHVHDRDPGEEAADRVARTELGGAPPRDVPDDLRRRPRTRRPRRRRRRGRRARRSR